MNELAVGISLVATIFAASEAAQYEREGRTVTSLGFNALAIFAGVVFAKALVLLLGGAS